MKGSCAARVVIALLLPMPAFAPQAPVKCAGPLSVGDLVTLVKGQVPEPRLRLYVATCGVAFAVTPEDEAALRTAGIGDALLALVREKAARAAADAADTLFWSSIREGNDRESFEDYLRRFPSGLFRTLAAKRLKEVRVADLRRRIPIDLGARRFDAAEQAIAELDGLVPGDAEVSSWRRDLGVARASDRSAAEKAASERAGREEEERAFRQARADFAGDFVWVEPGGFVMGCSEDDRDCEQDEKPPRRVRISRGFEIQKHEVTQALWRSVMATDPSRFKGPRLPVESASWDEVADFLAKLNLRGDGYRYRLPTEAEWEFAARAGTAGRYAGRPDEVAWYDGNAGGTTHPVGQKKPNAWGLYDTQGNVRERCADWYDEKYYRKGPAADPTGPGQGKARVVRGGSWLANPWQLRLSARASRPPDLRDSDVGLRLVRERAR